MHTMKKLITRKNVFILLMVVMLFAEYMTRRWKTTMLTSHNSSHDSYGTSAPTYCHQRTTCMYGRHATHDVLGDDSS
jgi:hypothetical protein